MRHARGHLHFHEQNISDRHSRYPLKSVLFCEPTRHTRDSASVFLFLIPREHVVAALPSNSMDIMGHRLHFILFDCLRGLHCTNTVTPLAKASERRTKQHCYPRGVPSPQAPAAAAS